MIVGRTEFTDNEVKEIIRAYSLGDSIENISYDYYCRPGTISKVLKASNIKVRVFSASDTSRLKNESVEKLRAMYHANPFVSLYDIARVYNVSRPTVASHFKAVGIEIKPQRRARRCKV